MLRQIAHRGAWWPREEAQNLQSSVASAFAHGWGTEIDVWGPGVQGNTLISGHDGPMYEITLPVDDTLWKNEPLFLHMKITRENNLWKIRMICDLLRDAGRIDQSYIFWSPAGVGPEKEIAEFGIKQLLVVDCREALEAALQDPDALTYVAGLWLEQPDEDWVSELTIAHIRHIGKSVWVVSPELHGRSFDLAKLSMWREADGICTDTPHLLGRLLDINDGVVYPTAPWWQ